MKTILILGLALASCGVNDDRVTDEQAAAEQNATIGAPVAIEQPATLRDATTRPAPSYKAVGTEPGWALTVTPNAMTYEGDYGSVKISEPTPPNFRPAPGRYSGTRIKLTITPGPCSDGMSDLIYRQSVRLVADGKTVDGCGGGTVAPDALAGTNWTVTAINGRETPGGQNYFVNFTASDVSAKFGCNSIGGGYQVNGDHLSTDDLAQTEMACGEPAMSFERIGSAVLSSNMRVERAGGETMRLVSEAGSIDLRRAI